VQPLSPLRLALWIVLTYYSLASRLPFQPLALPFYSVSNRPAPFAMAAVPLIVCGEDGGYHVHESGAALLTSLKGKIAVVCLAGKYRTGKSFLLNQLVGQKLSFSVGNTVESHTRGIWISAPGIVSSTEEGEEADVVFMDSEGMSSTDKVGAPCPCPLLPRSPLSLTRTHALHCTHAPHHRPPRRMPRSSPWPPCCALC
jgi:hypothetical protein